MNADEGTPPDDSAVPVTQEASTAASESARQFWTKERMESAEPMDMPVVQPGEEQQDKDVPDEAPSPIVHPPASAALPLKDQPPGANENGTERENALVPSTVGRLFFTVQRRDGTIGTSSCTVSTVAAGDGSKIITAGHCVHAGDNTTWYSNFVFAPAYYKGDTPYGLWFGERWGTFTGWARDGDPSWDQAVIQVERKLSGSVVDTVGGNGLVGGHGPDVAGNRIWGYPADAPFDGELPYYCDGDATGRWLSTDSQMDCGMNGGASGGPWLKDRIDANLGYTWAVTSRCESGWFSEECALTKLFSTPNPVEIFNLVDL